MKHLTTFDTILMADYLQRPRPAGPRHRAISNSLRLHVKINTFFVAIRDEMRTELRAACSGSDTPPEGLALLFANPTTSTPREAA